MADEGDHEATEHPIEEVRLTVPTTDDPSLPAFTFRTLVLGLTACVALAFLNELFSYQKNPIYVDVLLVQILSLPAGRFMAATLPSKVIRVPLTPWEFSMNPGPFNMKEHVLIATLANGAGGSYATSIIAAMKVYFHRPINPWAVLLLVLTTNMVGYGLAGIFLRFLVHNPYMWWPSALVNASFYRALNEKDVRPKGQLTRLQLFVVVFISSFAYFVIPNYLFPSITALSFVCWVWKDSVTAQQLGSGLQGLGFGAISFDWLTATGFLGSPLALPISSIINLMIGFVFFMYIICPIFYWTNSFEAKRFPVMSLNPFDAHGMEYNVSRVLKREKFEFDREGYSGYSRIYLSIANACNYGFDFAATSSSLSHFALFHGRSFWRQFKESYNEKKFDDIHTIMMKKYDPVPQWWFLIISLSSVALAFVTCEGFGKQLQLPYWGVILAFILPLIFMLPIGIMQATTGQSISLSLLSELIIGYLHPGRPLSNVTFKAYGISTMDSALAFMTDFKLGYYMKIPPKSMFFAQVFGALTSSLINFGVTWWLFTSERNICNPELLPKGSPWTCPFSRQFYTIITIWGVIGPSRVFYPFGVYSKLFVFFIIGAISPLPVWILSHIFPEKKWIKLINFPVIFSAGHFIPPVAPVNFWSWFAIGIIFNHVIYKRFNNWWARYNYLVSVGLTSGIVAMALLANVTLQNNGINGVDWWGLDIGDHCPLASCPTSPGIEVEGCPKF